MWFGSCSVVNILWFISAACGASNTRPDSDECCDITLKGAIINFITEIQILRWAIVIEMLHNNCDMFKVSGEVRWMCDWYLNSESLDNYKAEWKVILPTPRRHPRSFPGCPTRLRGWPGRSERGSGTARSPSPDRRLFSASCHSAASAQSGTGVSHSADEADKVEKEYLKSYNSGYVLTATLSAYLQYPFQRIKIVLLTLQDRAQDTSSHQLQREDIGHWEFLWWKAAVGAGGKETLYLLLRETIWCWTENGLDVEAVHLNKEFRLLIVKTGWLPL